MPPNPLNRVLDHLFATARAHDVADHSDGKLLASFIERRDQAAFAALVERHGTMVWNVCRRILTDHHDVEDAFQVTFLVLVRKAPTVIPQEMVGNWLYGVACQTARKARSLLLKRRTREKQVAQLPEPVAQDSRGKQDWQDLLDQELSRLPGKYRLAIVLCDLEGKTRREASQQIGVPEGTLASRLARGRAMLTKRLARQGAGLPAGSLVGTVAASVPGTVVSATVRAACLVAAGQAVTAGVISPKVAALTKGVLTAMLLTKLKTATCILCLSAAGLGAGIWAFGAPVGPGALAQPEKAPQKEVEIGKTNVAPQSQPAKEPQANEQAKEDVIKPGDPLVVQVTGTPENAPIKGIYVVEGAGTVPLGPMYGRVQVAGLSLIEAEKAIQKHLLITLREVNVMVTRNLPSPIYDAAQGPAMERRIRRLEEEVRDLRTVVDRLQRKNQTGPTSSTPNP